MVNFPFPPSSVRFASSFLHWLSFHFFSFLPSSTLLLKRLDRGSFGVVGYPAYVFNDLLLEERFVRRLQRAIELNIRSKDVDVMFVRISGFLCI